MATEMTRAEYEAKYGSPAPTATSAPVQMTRAQYDAKYGSAPTTTTPAAPQRRGIFESIAKRPLERLVLEPARRAGEAAGSAVVSLIGNEQQKQVAATEAGKDKSLTIPFLGKFNTRGYAGKDLKQAAGEGLETASYLFPYGKAASAAGKVLPKAMAPVASGAAGGYVADVGFNLQEGKAGAEALKPGMGTVVGAAIPGAGAAGGILRKSTSGMAPRLINSLIKPLSKDFAYGKNPGRTVAELGITANSFEELAKNVGVARRDLGQHLQQVSDQVPGQLTLSQQQLLEPFENAITKAVSSNNQAMVTRLTQARDAITKVFDLDRDGKIVPVGSRMIEGLTYKQGVELKQLVGDLTEWTGKHTEDTTVNGALTRTYGVLKDGLNELADKAGGNLGPLMRELNEKYADLTSAEIATKYRDVLQQRQNMVNLPGKIGLGMSLISAPFTGGLVPVLGSITSIVLDKALSSVAFKTRLASALAKAAPKDLSDLATMNPGIITKLKAKFPDIKFPGDAFLETRLFKKASDNIKNAQPGLSMKAVTNPDIHPDDLHLMHQFIDHTRIDGPLSDGQFAQVEKLAQHFGISMDKGLKGVADAFEKVLTGARKATGTMPRARDEAGRFSKKPVLPSKR